MTAGAVRVPISAGEVTHRQGEPAPHLELVVSGLVRVYVSAPDGRSLTVRYCRPGALIGAVSLFAQPFTMPATTQALVDAAVLRMSPTTVRRMVAGDPRVARVFLVETSERVLSFVHQIPGGAFATVRERVARHLLDLAADRVRRPENGGGPLEMVAPISQRELAEAVGTVREVVVRVLRELRTDGVIQTGRDEIVILDPARLLQEQGWNPGS